MTQTRTNTYTPARADDMAGADRRAAPRVHYTGGLLPPTCRVRPGRDVIVVNLARGGTLVESRFRFRPGSMVDVLLHQGGIAHALRARITRCLVATLDDPAGVRYRTALRFETPIAAESPRTLLDGYVLPDVEATALQPGGSAYPKRVEDGAVAPKSCRNVQPGTTGGLALDLVRPAHTAFPEDV